MGKSLKEERLGATGYNKQGCLMKVIEYNRNNDIVVEFQDEYKEIIHTNWPRFVEGSVTNPINFKNRLGQERVSTQGCVMKIVEYINSENFIVEFQDQYKWKTQTDWTNFNKGTVRNRYYPSVRGVGIIGDKYPISNKNGKGTKEYTAWKDMLERCYCKKTKQKRPSYRDVTCCKEWLLFDNFYEWLHSQDNFEMWKKGSRYCLDKDILVKGNKMYGPDTCCLVPNHVNVLFENKPNFTTKDTQQLPLGVVYWDERNKYIAQYNTKRLGYYESPEEAFGVYKKYREAYIKQVAQEEYEKGTISKKCYEAMMKWEVEITD